MALSKTHLWSSKDYRVFYLTFLIYKEWFCVPYFWRRCVSGLLPYSLSVLTCQLCLMVAFGTGICIYISIYLLLNFQHLLDGTCSSTRMKPHDFRFKIQKHIWNSSLEHDCGNAQKTSSDLTSVNYNIIHTLGKNILTAKILSMQGKKSTSALQHCPAFTSTLQSGWPGKPELDFYGE